MSDDTTRPPRRRPVDVLFGEDMDLTPRSSAPDPDAPRAPGYMVELPRPVTSVRPPPPEFPSDWRATVPAQVVSPPASVPAGTPPAPDLVEPPPQPAAPAPVVQAPAEAVTFTLPAVEKPAPAPVPPPIRVLKSDGGTPPTAAAPVATVPLAPGPALPLYGQTELLELSQFVDQLYQNVADETADSAALNVECLDRLAVARHALEKRQYAVAETAAEQVKSRLLLARASRSAAASSTTRVLFAWLIVAGLLGVVLFALPFVLRIVPPLVPLLRGIALGMLGGAVIALWQLPRHIARHTFDETFNASYALSPVLGAVVGGAFYLLSLLGILAAPNALGLGFEPYLLMYLFALLGGLANEAIFGGIRRAVSRITGRAR